MINFVKALQWILLLFSANHVLAQTVETDPSIFMRDSVRPLVKRLENLRFSGYIQPQYQVASHVGSPNYNGGNFPEQSNNRFMLRRARMKLDYNLQEQKKIYNDISEVSSTVRYASFTFQIDATERGVVVRDMYARIYHPRRQNLFASMGLFNRPFGFEVNLSSGQRESPERGRASQILMPGERDLGVMVSYEMQRETKRPLLLKLDAGIFNGQGPSGVTDFDSYKDLASRLTFKPLELTKNISISGGLSLLLGGWLQATRYKYEVRNEAGKPVFFADSSISNIGDKAARKYYGGDIRFLLKSALGKTELRSEYWMGTQSGSLSTSTSPATLPLTPTYTRKFNAAFFYFIQSLGSKQWEAVVKYDWYDPNAMVKGSQLGASGSNFSAADIKYNTLGLGLTRYINSSLKILAYYDFVRNENTLLTGFGKDVEDNVFTVRMQVIF